MGLTPLVPGRYYHVYNRSINSERIFLNDRNYRYFLGLMKKYLFPVAEFYSYVLLPDHFHLVLQIKEENMLPCKYAEKPHLAFSHLFNAYTKAFNKLTGRRGSLFEKNFKRKEITGEPYLKNLILYVNTNPEHHGLRNWRHYPYSSLPEILDKRYDFIDPAVIHHLFDDMENFRYLIERKRYNMEMIKELIFDE